MQYGLSVRDGRIADKSQSNGFESDNDASGSTASPFTTATFSNMTFIGPRQTDGFVNTTDFINGGDYFPSNGSGLGRFQAAMQIRRGSRLNCINSVAIGWPIGLILDGEKGNTQSQAASGALTLQNLWLADCELTGSDANKLYEDVLVTGYDENKNPIKDATKCSFSTSFFQSQKGNRVATLAELAMTGKDNQVGLYFNYLPSAGSPLLTAASFTGASSFFDAVPYIGAFAPGNDWIKGWTNFDPNNTDY